MLEHAKYLIEQGFNIFPLLPNSKDPATPHGFKDATDNIEQFIKLLNGKTDFNIGLAMGSGVIAIDVDPRNGGSETYSEIMVDHQIPDTVRSMTGGELTGMHLFFSVNEEHRCKTQFLPGIDTKGDGGYVVSSPSIHPDTGKRYQWVPGAMPHEVSIKPLPDYLNHKKVGKFALNKEVIRVDDLSFNTADYLKQDVFLPANNGNRNNACTSLAGYLIQQDIKPKVILSMCQSWNRTNPEPLQPNEIQRTVESVFRTHENNHPVIEIPEKYIENEEDKPNLTLKQLKVGGLIQEMCEWMDKCARKKTAYSIMFYCYILIRNLLHSYSFLRD